MPGLDDNWSFVYIYERPILISHLNQVGSNLDFDENVHILCKLDENVCISKENAHIFIISLPNEDLTQ